jgi:hypothetical protein
MRHPQLWAREPNIRISLAFGTVQAANVSELVRTLRRDLDFRISDDVISQAMLTASEPI